MVRELHQEKGVTSDDEESRDYPRGYADQDIIDDDEPGHESVDSWCATDFITSTDDPITLLGHDFPDFGKDNYVTNKYFEQEFGYFIVME